MLHKLLMLPKPSTTSFLTSSRSSKQPLLALHQMYVLALLVHYIKFP